MESQTVSHIHQSTPGAGGVRAKVERGQRGTYAWELSIDVPRQDGEGYEAAFARAAEALTAADATMRRLFGAEGGPEAIRPAA
jgi:hypothetical protein